MSGSINKKRVLSLDLIRCFATLCIVLFHFQINSSGDHIYPERYFFFNYDIAQVGVSLFFILSGAALYYNDSKKTNLKGYFKKRFLAIFPMFYIAYIFIFLFSFWKEKHIILGVPIRNILFSLIGMDGLLSYKIPCFSMTGEWFLGCIIILYILYPILKIFIKKIPKTSFLFMIIIYVFLCQNYNFDMPILFNPFVRFIEFTFGMLYMELHNKRKDNWLEQFYFIKFTASFILTIIMLYVKLPIPQIFKIAIGGCSLFVAMMELGKLIKNKFLVDILKLGSKYSFAIFLLHHYIANYVRYHFLENLTLFESLLAFTIYIIIVLIFAVLLFKITDKVLDFLKSFKKNYNTLRS